MQTKVLNSPNN